MEQKLIPENLKEFVVLLNKHNVNYLLIGGWAINMYIQPRFTKDVDFLMDSKSENVEKLKDVLRELGVKNFNIESFKTMPDEVITLGVKPLEIEIFNKIDGLNTEETCKNKQVVNVDGIDINIISIDDLIINKKASGRLQDLADVEKLEKKRENDELQRKAMP